MENATTELSFAPSKIEDQIAMRSRHFSKILDRLNLPDTVGMTSLLKKSSFSSGETIIPEDGQIHVEVKLLDKTVWLTLDQMAVLFDKSKSTISEHIRNIYQEGELSEAESLRKFGNSEFSTKPTNFYNLDVIISVGYRVKSIRGTQFRKWAPARLHEYIVKGFTMDDERLMRNGQSKYFEELLGRIRNIRSSEHVLWEKILDIFAYRD